MLINPIFQLNNCSYVVNKNNNIVCQVNIIDEKKVKAVQKKILGDSLINELSETFKNLSDFTRLKILLALAEEELCVCDIAALTDVSVSAISHQLRLLKNNRLVTYKKKGKMVYYSLDDGHVKRIVKEAARHSKEMNI